MSKKLLRLSAVTIALFLLTACQKAPDSRPAPSAPPVTDFEECVAAGNPVMESFPRQCRHNGQTFTEKINGLVETAVSVPEPQGNEMDESCTKRNGTWLEESKECEGISQSDCESLGGTFNECASACRNDPEAEICTRQCVLVCQF